MAHFLTLRSVEFILEEIRGFFPVEAEGVPLDAAFGRILAEPFPAPEDLPGFDRSTMDGYAVRAKDVFGASEGLPALLYLVGECPMGQTPELSIAAGEAARIWTGGMLPKGADAVVMLEYAREAGPSQVELVRPAAPGENIITADEDAAKGQELLPAGCVLRPQEMGLLAALGQESVRVRRFPKVAVISSGDEIVPLNASPAPGQVRDINSYTLMGLVRAAGCVGRAMGIAKDSREHLAALLDDAMAWADVVLLSGGSSAGQRDFTLQALEAIPGVEVVAHGVAISPGKPLIMARKGQQSLWGLPGHAASALVCAEVFIRPLLRQLLGVQTREIWRQSLKAVLTRPIASAQGRRDYIRVRLDPAPHPGGLPESTPVLGKSGLITTLVEAQALIVCPEDQEGLAAGQVVHLLLLV